MSAETTWARQPAERESHVAHQPKAGRTEAEPSALERLRDAVQSTASSLSTKDSEIPVYLGVLEGAIRQACDGAAPNLWTLPSYAPARRLIDELRVHFIARSSVSPLPSAASVLSVLRGIECVRAALDTDAAQRLASRLPHADALEMVVAVAHDMRSPLTSVLLLVDALRRGQSGPLTPYQERQLVLVYGAVYGLSSLASDLLDLARGGDRLLDPEPVPFSIGECLHLVGDIVQPIAEEKKLELLISAPSKGDRRLGQPAALTRVLLNLTINALKFTHQGNVTISVTELSRTDVEFTVRDTGRGIPADVVETLFDAFRQPASSGRTVFSSAGLGLSICQKLVSAMGGTLAVESVIGEFTRFSFRLNLPLLPHL